MSIQYNKKPIMDSDLSDPGTLEAIARAKLEWESTADALPHVVCLLDQQGRVRRINRVIERWNLGTVIEARGRDVHAVLHPRCVSDGCELRDTLSEAWSALGQDESVQRLLVDGPLERALQLTLRALPESPTPGMSSTRATLVVADVTDLHLAQIALRSMNAGLEERVHDRTQALEDANANLRNAIARRESAEDALRGSRDELSLLSGQLISAQEAERKRIASELHDSIGQALTAVQYELERAVELSRRAVLQDPLPVLNRAIAGIQAAIAETRGIAMNLRPTVLDDLGAASAIGWLCREFRQTYPSIRLHVRVEVEDRDIPDRLATTLFRSVQELLNNVAKHAKANESWVVLTRDAFLLCVEVSDDGVGLPPIDSTGARRYGHGIRNLRERAEMSGGRFSLHSPGGGTVARMEWSLNSADSLEA